MKKGFNRCLVIILMALLLAVPALAKTASEEVTVSYRDISIKVDGEAVDPTDINGKATEPFLIDGSTYVPVRAISEALGCEVTWDGDTNTVNITTTPSWAGCVTSYDAATRIAIALTDDLAERAIRIEEDSTVTPGGVYTFSDSDGDWEFEVEEKTLVAANDETETGWVSGAVIAYVGFKEDGVTADDNCLTFFYTNGAELRDMAAADAAILDLTGSGVDSFAKLDDMMVGAVHIANESGKTDEGVVDYIVITDADAAGADFYTLSVTFAPDSGMADCHLKYFYGDDGFGGNGLFCKGKINMKNYCNFTGSLQGDDTDNDFYKYWAKIEYWKYNLNEDGTVNTTFGTRTQVCTRDTYFSMNEGGNTVEYGYAIVQSAILDKDVAMDYSGVTFVDVTSK